MKVARFLGFAGLSIAIAGFLIGVLAEDRQLGKLLILCGFLVVTIGIVGYVFLGRSKGPRGAGMRIAAGGFAISAVGVLFDGFVVLIPLVGDTLFAIGAILMVGGILFHLVNITRSDNDPDE